MGLPNLSGSNIQDTFQRVLQTDNGTLRDGTGSLVILTNITASGDITTSGNIYGSSWYGSSGGRIYPAGLGSGFLGANVDSLTINDTSLKVQYNITASGHISSSGNIITSKVVLPNGVNTGIGTNEALDDSALIFNANQDITLTTPGGKIILAGAGGIDLGTSGTTTVASGSLTVLGTLDAGDVFTSELTNGSLTYCTVGQEIHFGAITGSGGPTPLKLFANETASLVIGVDGNITTIGDITANGTILGLDILSKNNPSSGLKFNSGSTDVLHNLVVTGSITASGNISSSGTITAASFVGNMDGGSF